MSRHDTVALDDTLARAGDGVFVVGREGRIPFWGSRGGTAPRLQRPGNGGPAVLRHLRGAR
jgi:hypothetical protein